MIDRDDFLPRGISFPTNPTLGALAAQSVSFFETTTATESPQKNRSKRNKHKRKQKSLRKAFRSAEEGTSLSTRFKREMSFEPNPDSTKEVKLPYVSFSRGSGRKIHWQARKPNPENVTKSCVTPVAKIDGLRTIQKNVTNGNLSSVSASRFRYVSCRKRKRQKGSIVDSKKTKIAKRHQDKQFDSKKRRLDRAKASSHRPKSKAIEIMTEIITGKGGGGGENGGSSCGSHRTLFRNNTAKGCTQNSMCHLYVNCYCEDCFNVDFDWDFSECKEASNSGRYNRIWNKRNYCPCESNATKIPQL